MLKTFYNITKFANSGARETGTNSQIQDPQNSSRFANVEPF
jgi:hypothetical protein